MNAAAVQSPLRTTIRWGFAVALIFAVHIGLVFALGDSKPVIPRQPGFTPQLHLAVKNDELLALNDPSLFALPHMNGFSGAAWMRMPRVQPGALLWSEPPRWLQPPLEQLGAAFSQFMQTNQFARYVPEIKSAPQLTTPGTTPVVATAELKSALEIEGELALRKLLNSPEIPSWPATDLLTESTVQVLVDETGNVISTTLLPPGSGSKEADQRALNIAKAAKFSSMSQTEAMGVKRAVRWTRGKMIFHWQTVPLLQTNAPPSL